MNDDSKLIEALGVLTTRYQEEREEQAKLIENLKMYRKELAEARVVHLAAQTDKDKYAGEIAVLKRDRARMIGEAEDAEERRRWVAAKLQQERTKLRERLTGIKESREEEGLLAALANMQDVLQGNSELHKGGGG